jgi:hypothetical protein
LNRRDLIAWIIIAAMSLIIVTASYALGPPHRKLPLRDYLPLLAGAVWVAWAQWRERR